MFNFLGSIIMILHNLCIAIVGELQLDTAIHSAQGRSIAIAKLIRIHFETHAEGSLHFWECPSKAEWFIHAEVHKKRLPGCATQSRNKCKLHTTCWGERKNLEEWVTDFNKGDTRRRDFLTTRMKKRNESRPTYVKMTISFWSLYHPIRKSHGQF